MTTPGGPGGHRELREVHATAVQLQEALAGRAPVEQAKGILMALHRVGADAALDLLRLESQRSSTTLRDVAAALVAAQAGGPASPLGAARPRAGGTDEDPERSAFDHAPLGMAVTDPSGVLLTVNPALATLLGSDAAQLVATTLLERTHPDDLAAVRTACEGLREGVARQVTQTVRLRGRDGAWVTVRVSTAAVSRADGRPARLVTTVEDVTEQHAVAAELRHRSSHDPLTGLANRTLLLQRLGDALGPGLRPGDAVSVLFCDVDEFKAINDAHGHAGGDAVLRTLAGRWRAVLRAGDTLARFGGDEIVVCCPGTGATAARRLVGRLQAALLPPFDLAGVAVRVTVSIGAATSTPGRSTDPAALLWTADAAMYEAKRARPGGRGLHR